MTETPAQDARSDSTPEMPRKRTRLRRWLIAGAAVVVVAATVVVYGVTRPGPVDVVEEYLSVLQSGDAEAALDYASSVDDFDKVSRDLLVDEAMATDWKATNPDVS